MMSLAVLYMPFVMKYILSDGNHMNGNNTTTSLSSLSDAAAAVAVASQ